MRILMIRHGQTEGNRLRRYVGSLDEPLCPEGIEVVRSRGSFPGISRVYTSALVRTQQTARLLFPRADIRPVAAFNEQNFGDYQGLSYDSVSKDPSIQGPIINQYAAHYPGGESTEEVISRVTEAFVRVLLEESALGSKGCVFVVHAGTIMSVMQRFAMEQRESYYDWHDVGNVWGRLFEIDTGMAPRFWAIDHHEIIQDFSLFQRFPGV